MKRDTRRWRTALPLLLSLLALACAAREASAQSNTPIQSFWVTDDSVHTMARAGGRLYIGGAFNAVGPVTGPSVRVDATTAAVFQPNPVAEGVNLSTPPVVSAVVPDGHGGWFMGGSFAKVGGLPRSNLAHVLADGRVSSWNPGAGATVHGMALDGTTLYIGGIFSTVGGQSRSRLAAVDTVTGAVLPWNPGASGGWVHTLAVDGSVVYVGGEFTSAGGQTRSLVAAISKATGLATSWNATVSGTAVWTLAVTPGAVYAGGKFTAAGGQTRTNLAALNKSSGAATTWTANANSTGIVQALALSATRLIVGGSFTTIAGQSRSGLAAFRLSDGTFDSVINQGFSSVLSLSVTGSTVYVGGDFTYAGGVLRLRAAALDESTGALGSWHPSVTGPVYSVASLGNDVFLGGDFASAGALLRSRIAAIDEATGAGAAFDPGADNWVNGLETDGTRLYAGGSFTQMGGQSRGRGASFDLPSEALNSWNPSADNGVNAFHLSGGRLFAFGGGFSSIGGLQRDYVASFDASTGVINGSFNPDPGSFVNAVAGNGAEVYLGGPFLQLGLTPRSYLGAVNAANGADLGWNPQPNGNVTGLLVDGTTLYVGGTFTLIGGASRARIAAFDLSAGRALKAWNPVANDIVTRFIASGGTLFAGGSFTTIGGGLRKAVAAFDAATGSLLPWNPMLDGAIAPPNSGEVGAVSPKRIYVRGTFRRVGLQSRSHLAAFCRATAPTGLSASAGVNLVSLSWSGTAGSYNVYRSRVSGGAYEMVGSSPAASYTDTTVQGGVTYFYVVRGVDECESDLSNEATATPTGACSLPADFDGVGSAVQAAGSGCAVNLSWATAVGPCGGSVTYSVYRGASGFVPNSSTQVAAGVTGTTYVDAVFLGPGQTYEYVVRARVAGIEDANEIRAALAASACSSTPPGPLRALTVRSGDGSNTLEWANPLAPYVATHVCAKAGGYPTGPTDGACQDVAGAAGDSGQLVDGVANGTTQYYAAWADATGLGDYSTPRTSWGRPADTSGAFKWAYTTSATTVAPLGVIPGRSYFAVSNDKVLHGMAAGTDGGVWPPTFVPPSFGAAAQGRPVVVHLSPAVAGATDVAFVGAQNGRVYAFDAATGTSLWTSAVLGDLIQSSPAAIFTAFGGAHDLLFVGTRNSTAGNSLYALRLADGAVAWQFDNGGGANAIGLITTQAHVDYGATPRLYFTSHPRTGGSSDTVWCLQFSATSATKVWSQPVGSAPIDTGPARTAAALYVGNADGEVYKLDPANGSALWPAPYATGDGPVKGYVWRQGDVLFFSTNGLVHAVDASGSTPVAFWTGGAASSGAVIVANPSPPIVWQGRVYIGGGDGRVYSIDAASSAPGVPASVMLGDPLVLKVLGSPTLDTTLDLLLIGSDQGAVYAVQLPF